MRPPGIEPETTETGSPSGIDGFMAVRNGFRYGYAFLEAIRSVLPLCDTVHVTDGFSDDGTFEALQALAAREPRVHLVRERWLSDDRGTRPGGGGPIREALNSLRRELTAPILFQFDANDFLPPEDVPVLRELPRLYPRREIFALPYRQFLGRYWFNEEFRFRLVRNLPTVQVLWDGWTLGYHLGLADLLTPRELRRAMGRTALTVLQDRVAVDLPEQWAYLPTPIFHYYGLFPQPFLEKMEVKVHVQRNPRYAELTRQNERIRAILTEYETSGDYDRFWARILEHQRGLRLLDVPLNKEFLYSRFVPDEEHPRILDGVLGRRAYSTGPA